MVSMKNIDLACSRRSFLQSACCGIGGLALASMLHDEQRPRESARPASAASAGQGEGRHLPFHGGRAEPPGNLRSQAAAQPAAWASPAGGVRAGELSVHPARCPAARQRPAISPSTGKAASRCPISFRTPPDCIDDLAVIRSCHGDSVVHSAAQYETVHGARAAGLSEHGLVDSVRAGQREPIVAGLRRHARSARGARGRAADVHQRLSARGLSADDVSRRRSAGAQSRSAGRRVAGAAARAPSI